MNQSQPQNTVSTKRIHAGNRTYFLDIKQTRNSDYYITITEAKKMMVGGNVTYEKNRIFIYREEFEKLQNALASCINEINAF